MNMALSKAAVWLTELGVRTNSEQTHLAVNRGDLASFGTEAELLAEIKSATGSQRLFWTTSTDEWINLEAI